MTIRRRIFISNTAIVLISLVLLLVIVGGAFKLFEYNDKETDGKAGLSEYTYEIQTLLREEQQSDAAWDIIAEKAQAYGFSLYVADASQSEVYSDVSDKVAKNIRKLGESQISAQGVNLNYKDGTTYAIAVFQRGGQDYNVYAVHSETHSSRLSAYSDSYGIFVVVFIFTGLLAIAVLLLLSQFFTRLLVKKIMKPVEVLEQAALRINNGDLDTQIIYDKPDEFLSVCRTFNQMQAHLKEGMLKNAAYEKARTEMVAGISHDLRTPLTSVKGFIKGILDGVANTPEKQERYLQVSYQKACEMDVLLQKLFFFSKLETGNMPFFMQQADAGAWLECYVSEKQEECREKGFSLQLSKEAQTYPVMIDADQMKRVFDNLLENSIKYADVPELLVSIQVRKTASAVIITVGDNGKGIDAEKLPRVFEQFYRGDEARNTKKEGNGLGLYVCSYIVKQHSGTINAYCDGGFRVEIELPAAV